MGNCDPGLRTTRDLTVTADLCSDQIGSGELAVLGTPALLALAERACIDAIRADVPADDTTVGSWAEVEHIAPAPVGAVVTAQATLIGHHGRRLEFNVIVRQADHVIAKVRHRRVLVDRQVFMSKLGATVN